MPNDLTRDELLAARIKLAVKDADCLTGRLIVLSDGRQLNAADLQESYMRSLEAALADALRTTDELTKMSKKRP